MIRPAIVWAIARAEARLTRRLVRYWLFLILATLFGLLGFAQFWGIHHFVSGNSASAAAINPRFFLGVFSGNFLFFFLLGLIFLGFDVRSRDSRERMHEVLDALPCTNLELVSGKFLGLLLPSWIPAIVVSLLMFGVSYLPFVDAPIEPLSLITFIVFMAIPAFTFTLGLVFFVSFLVRNRLFTALIVGGLVVGAVLGSQWFITVADAPFIDLTGGYSVPYPSDIVGQLIQFNGLLHQIGVTLAGIALLLFSVALHPRRDDGSRAASAGIGAAAMVVALLLAGWSFYSNHSGLNQQESWMQAHDQRRDDPTPDLLALGGEARIDPGKRIVLDLRLTIAAPAGESLDSALFTLNPGLAVGAVGTESGQALEFTHENGLLEIRLARGLAPGEQTTLTLEAEGETDPNFAYLDSVVQPLKLSPRDVPMFVLGFDNQVWDRRYVALMPGVRWLPTTGSESGRGDARVRPADFFDLDLVVDLPEGFVAAGPGRRQDADGAPEAGRVRYRYAPPSPVPEVPLIAGRMASYSTELNGVQLEILIDDSHVANVEFFEDAAVEIREWLTERMEEAEQLGLPYPYDALTMVEIPNNLRGYGGGWRMDSTMIQPAMILMRETSFPTAYFKWPFRDPERFRDQEGGVPRAKREMLERFFENDMNGGNPFVAASRSFFGYQTTGQGPAGMPLDFVFENLATRLLTDKQSYFSIHMFDSRLGQTFQQAGMQMGSVERVSDRFADVMIHMLTSTPSVWDAILETSLVDLDPWQDPEKTINALSLKGGAMAQSLLDGLGREKSGALLADLREGHTGAHFVQGDVAQVGERIGEDLERWLAVWLNGTELPGFTVGEITAERLTDTEDGAPRYQVLATIHNGEATPGLIRIDYRAGDRQSGMERDALDPVLVEASSSVEIGVVTSKPPRMVRIHPYLALNRDPFALNLPPIDEERIVEAEPFVGAREVEWSPPEDATIVVDDLDPGFSVEESGKGSWLRIAGEGDEVETDGGLPIAENPFRPPANWSRRVTGTAYGKYRHTLALAKAGSGERKAIFAAEIPRAGAWELEYYLPRMGRRGRRGGGDGDGGGGRGGRAGLTGVWKMAIVDDSGSREVTLDTADAEDGWNPLGSFELAGGTVRVEISNETDGRSVVADAIRWVPVVVGELAEAR